MKEVQGKHEPQASASAYFLSALLVTSLRALSQNKARFWLFYLFYNNIFAHIGKEIGFNLQENKFHSQLASARKKGFQIASARRMASRVTPCICASSEVAIAANLNSSISTALIRPRRPRQYCLQLYTYIYIFFPSLLHMGKARGISYAQMCNTYIYMYYIHIYIYISFSQFTLPSHHKYVIYRPQMINSLS